MKKIQLLLAFMAVCVCTDISAANRVAPVQPGVELKDGVAVYLYNVGTGQAVTYNTGWSSVRLYHRDVTMATPFVLSTTGEGYYRFRVTDTRYFLINSTDVQANTLKDNYNDFLIRDTLDGCHLIQAAPNYWGYNAAAYMGFGSSDYLESLLTSGNIIWKILPATDESMAYMARRSLYDILSAAETKGYCVDKYDAVYASASSTNEELIAAGKELTAAMTFTQGVPIIDGEYPMLLQDDPKKAWTLQDNTLCRNYNMKSGEQQTLTATVKVNGDASLYYSVYNANTGHSESGYWNGPYSDYTYYYYYNSGSQYYVNMQVYVDDKLVRNISRQSMGRNNWRYFERLSPGTHTIRWVATCPAGYNNQYVSVKKIGVYDTPLTEVTLMEPGSLGVEVLYQKNRVQDVRRLKVTGEMNSADLAQIDNMNMLFELDLSDASLKDIPENMFNRDTSNGGKSSKNYLYRMMLPQNVETIGKQAFRCSYIDEIAFPPTLKSIGESAFYYSYLREAFLPESVQTVGGYAFGNCYELSEADLPDGMQSMGSSLFARCFSLTKVHLPSNLTTLPSGTFTMCRALTDAALPTGLNTISSDAFSFAENYKASLPASITSIGERAFIYTATDTVALQRGISVGKYAFMYTHIKNLIIPEETTLGNFCFAKITNMQTAEFPTTFYTATNDFPILQGNTGLKQVTLKSATPVTGNYKDRFLNGCGKNMVVSVPDFLVVPYKQDSYWKDYTIEGFDNANVDFWAINQPLTLTYRDRLQGSPSVSIAGNASLTINGTAPMTIDDLTTVHSLNWPSTSAMVLSNCDNITINGTVTHRVTTSDNIWYAISLPFDFRPGDITTTNGAMYSIKYYDGASRAKNNVKVGNWKDLPADTIVTAGTGFIYRTSKDCYSYFRSLENGSRNTIVSNTEFAKSLAKNESANAAHKGWNLVGNPYQCYYNIHKLNTTAPITVFEHTMSQGWYNNSYVWRPSAGNYKAYSIIDDDYALLPNGAFFLQCPDEETSITFPTVGRQLTSTIEDQTGAKTRLQQPERRKLIDLVLGYNDTEDNTRVVFNDDASIDYEINCDASKFDNLDAMTPQLYTLDENGTRYAINERPMENGTVRLGLIIPVNGTYTLRVNRNRQAGTVLLRDKQMDVTTDITTDGYVFTAKASTIEDRFELVASTLVTGITEYANEPDVAVVSTEGGIQTTGNATVYSLDGRLLTTVRGGYVPLTAGVYIVRTSKQSVKVTVK